MIAICPGCGADGGAVGSLGVVLGVVIAVIEVAPGDENVR
jgi:hypothetical protein